MFKKSLIFFFVCCFYSVSFGTVIKKKSKQKKHKIQEDIVMQLEQILHLSSQLIRQITEVYDMAIEEIKCVATGSRKSSLHSASKVTCEACQKKLEGYIEKMKDMNKDIRSFSTCLNVLN